MKTIYTDHYGLRPIVCTALGIYVLVSSIIRGSGWQLVAGVVIGLAAVALAATDIQRRRKARREGRDPTIVRIVDAPDR